MIDTFKSLQTGDVVGTRDEAYTVGERIVETGGLSIYTVDGYRYILHNDAWSTGRWEVVSRVKDSKKENK